MADKLDLSDVKVARIKVSSLCGAGHMAGAAQEKECVMAIRKIMCACGSGLGSSLIVHMNTEEIVKKLGHPEIEVDHTTVSDINPSAGILPTSWRVFPTRRSSSSRTSLTRWS